MTFGQTQKSLVVAKIQDMFYMTQLQKLFSFKHCIFFVLTFAALVSQKSDLDYISFNWNKMTSAEFEEHWRANKTSKKADFIHMIEVDVATVMLLT